MGLTGTVGEEKIRLDFRERERERGRDSETDHHDDFVVSSVWLLSVDAWSIFGYVHNLLIMLLLSIVTSVLCLRLALAHIYLTFEGFTSTRITK